MSSFWGERHKVVGNLCVISQFSFCYDPNVLSQGSLSVGCGPDNILCDEEPNDLEFEMCPVMLADGI